MCAPEDIKVQQDDPTQDMYLIAKGECECYVRDENKKERFVRVLVTG